MGSLPRTAARRALGALSIALACSALAAGGASAAAPSAYTSFELESAVNPNVGQYDISAGGVLTPKNPPAVTSGSGPDGMAASPDGKSLYVAVAASMTIAQYSIQPDGSLVPKSPATVPTGAGTRPDGVAIHPSGRYLYVADNSNPGQILQFNIGAGGAVSPMAVPAVQSGVLPERVAVTPNGRFVYAINNGVPPGVQGRVYAYEVQTDGSLASRGDITTFGDFSRGIAVSPDSLSVYATNSDSIAQYDVQSNGALVAKSPATVLGGGPPGFRGITVASDGSNLYVTHTGFIHLSNGFVGQVPIGAGGALSPTLIPVTAGDSPVEVTLSFDGDSLYASNYDSDDISMFDVAMDGSLTPKTPATVAAGNAPTVIALNPPEAPAPPTTTPTAASEARTGSCRGKEATIVGTDGRDKLNGTAGDDVIVGFGGRDRIRGRGGEDTICGNRGADKLSGGGANDWVAGQFGPDEVKGNKGDDTLLGDGDPKGGGPALDGAGTDKLRGGAGADDCFGGPEVDEATGCETEDGIP